MLDIVEPSLEADRESVSDAFADRVVDTEPLTFPADTVKEKLFSFELESETEGDSDCGGVSDEVRLGVGVADQELERSLVGVLLLVGGSAGDRLRLDEGVSDDDSENDFIPEGLSVASPLADEVEVRVGEQQLLVRVGDSDGEVETERENEGSFDLEIE